MTASTLGRDETRRLYLLSDSRRFCFHRGKEQLNYSNCTSQNILILPSAYVQASNRRWLDRTVGSPDKATCKTRQHDVHIRDYLFINQSDKNLASLPIIKCNLYVVGTLLVVRVIKQNENKMALAGLHDVDSGHFAISCTFQLAKNT